MPVTPFHFGPGAALHALAPRKISFIAFCVANVLIDIEPLYYMLVGQWPWHRFFHTYIGATLIAVITVALFLIARTIAKRRPILNIFNWQSSPVSAVAVGAFAGTYSHIVLDSIMHADIKPFAPFSDGSLLLNLISLGALHWSCVLAGAIGLTIVAIRKQIS